MQTRAEPPTCFAAEACHVVGDQDRSGAELRFLRWFTTGLLERYADLGLDGTDASLVALAERLGVMRVATFDRRHFTVVRPAHAPAFTLLPD